MQSPVLATGELTLRLSVSLSICPSHADTESKRHNLITKDYPQIQKGSPLGRSLNESGVGKICNKWACTLTLVLGIFSRLSKTQLSYRPSSRTLVSGNIKFMRVFAGVFQKGNIKRQWHHVSCAHAAVAC